MEVLLTILTDIWREYILMFGRSDYEAVGGKSNIARSSLDNEWYGNSVRNILRLIQSDVTPLFTIMILCCKICATLCSRNSVPQSYLPL